MKFSIVLSIALAATKCATSHIPPFGGALAPKLSRDSVLPSDTPTTHQVSSSLPSSSIILRCLSIIFHPNPNPASAPRSPHLPPHSPPTIQPRSDDNDSAYGDDNYPSAYDYAQAHHLPGGYRTTPSTPLARHNFALAHGTLMALTFVLYFPLGAIVMHVSRSLHWHAAIQVFAYANAVAGLGLGVWLGRNVRYLDYAHTVIGMAVVAALVLQLGVGVWAHGKGRGGGGGTGKMEGEGEGGMVVEMSGAGGGGEEEMVVETTGKERGGRRLTGWKRGLGLRFVHRWVGRGLIALGIINGGLGLKLAQNTTGGKIAYGVVAGVVGLAYLILLSVTVWRRYRAKKEEKKVDAQGSMLT